MKITIFLVQQRREAKKLAESHKSKISSHSSSFTLPDEPAPETPEGREQYFMKNLQLGEQLMQQGDYCLLTKDCIICVYYPSHNIYHTFTGPAAHDAAATCFYRALVVYPEPTKLLEVLSQSLPEDILQLIVQKMAAEMRQSQAKVEEIE